MTEIFSSIQATYLHTYRYLVKAARPLGYAISLHGSMQRDLDLIAVPWTCDAAPVPELLEAIEKALKKRFGFGSVVEGTDNNSWPKHVSKPHGRLAFMILMGGALQIDLSVIPPGY